MGNGGSSGNGFFFWRKKVAPARREPFSKAADVVADFEALQVVTDAIKLYPPGTANRWRNLILEINRDPPVTEEMKKKGDIDPMRIDLDAEELRNTLRLMYTQMTSITSDGLALLREYMPKLYDKHSLDRGKRVSQKEREQKYLVDECYAYGELDFDIFATIYIKVSTVYGSKTGKSIFYDLGAGCGLLVFAAAFIGHFTRAIGVENVTSLLERGEKRMPRWEQMKEPFPKKIKDCNVEWVEDNILTSNFWVEGSFIFLHWTAFSKEQRATISKALSQCAEGSHVLSFTTPVEGDDFIVLVKDTCETSWGRAEFFFQEKVTPSHKQEE